MKNGTAEPTESEGEGEVKGKGEGLAEGEIAKLIDEQLELAASRLGALEPTRVHPSPVDHEERKAAHANFEDVLLGNAEATPEMLEELSILQSAPELSEEELARQALGQPPGTAA
jgi:hypothetical protein